jgi:hypothetical protein
MVPVFLLGGVSINAVVRQAQLEHSCYERAIKEPYDGNRQELHFVPHFMQQVERHVRHNRRQLLEIRQSV